MVLRNSAQMNSEMPMNSAEVKMKAYVDESKFLRRIYAILKNDDYAVRYLNALKSDSALTQFMGKVTDELSSQIGMKKFCNASLNSGVAQ